MARTDTKLVTPATLRAWELPEPGGDKSARGRLTVVGGTASTPGAVLLAAEAALRAGAGKLSIATVEPVAANLAVFFLRWRRLPAEQLAPIDEYLKSGKPVIGFRTSTHAFNYPEGHASREWNAFGERAFGSPPGWGGKANHTHYGHESSTDVSVIEEQAAHPVLKGIDRNFHVRSWLYKVLPDYPAKGSTWLLMGKAVDPNKEDAIENPVAWTWTSASGAKTFMTTLGHPEDFREEAVQRLFVNAVHWALDKPVPAQWAAKNAALHCVGEYCLRARSPRRAPGPRSRRAGRTAGRRCRPGRRHEDRRSWPSPPGARRFPERAR